MMKLAVVNTAGSARSTTVQDPRVGSNLAMCSATLYSASVCASSQMITMQGESPENTLSG